MVWHQGLSILVTRVQFPSASRLHTVVNLKMIVTGNPLVQGEILDYYGVNAGT